MAAVGNIQQKLKDGLIALIQASKPTSKSAKFNQSTVEEGKEAIREAMRLYSKESSINEASSWLTQLGQIFQSLGLERK